jgi:imidazolonepropionase-like amidohydrolase
MRPAVGPAAASTYRNQSRSSLLGSAVLTRSHSGHLRALRLALAIALPLSWTDPIRSEDELAAARSLFEANLEAIRRRDREAYLACYLESERLARVGPEGIALGFAGLAAGAGTGWPDRFEAQDLQLVPVRPGVVYGSYRYRVRYGAEEQIGLSERLFVQTDTGWKIAVTTAFAAPAETPPPPLALIGATVIDGTGAPPLADAAIVIRGGKIDCVGARSACPIPAGVRIVDCSGRWITPGLIDAHVHFSQTGWIDGRPDAYDARARFPYEQVQTQLRAQPEILLRSNLCAGVTSVFDVGGYPWTIDLAARVEHDRRAPRLVAAGPLLSTRDHWLNLPGEKQLIYLADQAAAREGVRYLAARGARAVKIWYIVDADTDFDAMAQRVLAAGVEARRLKLPLIVHATGLAEAKVAVRAGAKLLVHGVWDRPVDDEFIQLLRQHRTLYCPTILVQRGYARFFELLLQGQAPVIDDPNGCVDHSLRVRLAETATLDPKAVPEARAGRVGQIPPAEAIGMPNLLRLHQAGVPVVMGTDAGNPLTLHGPAVYAEMEAMQAAGLSAMEVLQAATLNGARALGREAELGTLAVGKLADLLVVDADPTADIANVRRLRYVMRGGELRSIDELQ